MKLRYVRTSMQMKDLAPSWAAILPDTRGEHTDNEKKIIIELLFRLCRPQPHMTLTKQSAWRADITTQMKNKMLKMLSWGGIFLLFNRFLSLFAGIHAHKEPIGDFSD